MRRGSGILVLALCLLVGARPEALHAQALSPEIIGAVLRYLAASDAGRAVVELDGFPNRRAARSAAVANGFRAGVRADVLRCSADRRDCRIVGGDERTVIRLIDFRATGRDREVLVQVVVSRQVKDPDGLTQLYPAVRELTVSWVDDAWAVTGDRLMFIR